MANRPAQRITPSSEAALIRRIGSPARWRPARGAPAGESGPSRPPRPTGILFGESSCQANRRQWRIGGHPVNRLHRHAGAHAGESGPSRPPRPAGILFGESPRQANRRQWRIGGHPVNRLPRHAGARRVAPRWRLGRRGTVGSALAPQAGAGLAGAGPMASSAPRHPKSCGICLTFAKGCRRNLSGNAVPPASDTRRWQP